MSVYFKLNIKLKINQVSLVAARDQTKELTHCKACAVPLNYIPSLSKLKFKTVVNCEYYLVYDHNFKKLASQFGDHFAVEPTPAYNAGTEKASDVKDELTYTRYVLYHLNYILNPMQLLLRVLPCIMFVLEFPIFLNHLP